MESRVQRLWHRLAFREVETVAQSEAVPFLDRVVTSACGLVRLEVVQAKRIHSEESVIAGVPGGGRTEVSGMAEDDDTDGMPFGIRAVVADPVRVLAPDVAIADAVAVKGLSGYTLSLHDALPI